MSFLRHRTDLFVMQANCVSQLVKCDSVIFAALAQRDSVAARVADARVTADAGENRDLVAVWGNII